MQYILDGSQMTTRESAHEHLAKQLRFPDYYGKNLDALYDCVTDLPDAEIVIVFSSAMDKDVQRVLLDAARHSSNLTVYLA
ncbi:MAG: barstar family protein [Oscillospiraceae bacterium]|nr:barstar family protein [Oscillospiraceae bacterium]